VVGDTCCARGEKPRRPILAEHVARRTWVDVEEEGP
jgi:hypothetical protein